MNDLTPDVASMRSIDLAREADFDLGLLHVRPARCEVGWNGASETLQRRVMQVLVALAQSRGSVVSQNDLIVRCWRGLSVSDDAIVRCISRLRKLAAHYPEAPYTIETIPGVGYRLTTSGAVEDERAAGSRRRSFRPRGIVIALVLLALIGAAMWIGGRSSGGQHPIRVAVRPFEALSDSVNVRSLARRIPNEVVDALGDSQIQTVLVGEEVNKGTTRSVDAQPGLIVTGILRGEGPLIIVDVRIENGANRAALWSAQFKRDAREASDLPSEIAARVADVVNMTNFARNSKPPLTDDSALTALLQTNDMIRDAHDNSWAPMLENARSVVARHPEFAFGHSVLAGAYAEAAARINVPDRAQTMIAAARREANLALTLDPEDAGAYAVLSGDVPFSDYRAQEAILLRGIKFAKHPKEPLGALYSFEGTLLSNVGRLREALSFQLIAQATDRWGAPKTVKVALNYANIGNLPAARSWIRSAVQRWPNHDAVRLYRLYITCFYERPADALAIVRSIEAQNTDDQTAVWRRFVEARAAHVARPSAATISEIREAADQGKIPREVEILMMAELGDTQGAIDAANLAVSHHDQLPPRFLFTPIARDLRRDPGFVRLADRLGLIKYWRETGKLPDFCTDQTTRSECSPQLLAAISSRSSP
jgi:DNA-binding winged helix-turn-helix (wHTH) protein/TolB-like protein